MNAPFKAPAIARAYSVLQLKNVDLEQRIIRGTATTPTPDRLGDIIEPLGVSFKNPMPLLWQHKHDKPVGWVNFSAPTEAGIEFEAKIARVDEPGALRERTEEAWQSANLGLVRAVSIGFVPKKYSFIKDTDGIRFEESEVIELSLVTIPANQDATITQIRSIDAVLLAASGRKATPVDGRSTPPAPRLPPKPSAQETRKMPKTVAEKISAYEATRAAKAAAMEKLILTEDDSTMSAEDQTKYDELSNEVKAVDGELERLRELQKTIKASAITVDATAEAERVGQLPAKANGNGLERVRVQVKAPAVEPWQPFIRFCMTMAYAKGDTAKAIRYAQQWKDSTPEVAYLAEHDVNMLLQSAAHLPSMLTKAAVPAGNTTDSTWAGPLVTYQVMASEFAGLLRPATIIGRIPGLRRVPFNIQLPATTSGTTVGWVGEGAPKPVSQMAFTTITMRWAKAAGIVVMTDELVRFSNPSAEAVVRDDLTRQMVQFLDRQFVDPAVAAVANVSPASITNGVTPITASGVDAVAFRNDIASLLNAFLGNNLSLASGFFIMTQQQASKISMMNNTFSQPIYPTVSMQGGTLLGFPVVASENLPATGGSPADGFPIIFGLADEIMLADDGVTLIDASNQASLQADSAPDSPPTASSPYISLWQTNMTALRAERWINWQKRRTNCVSFIQNAKYA